MLPKATSTASFRGSTATGAACICASVAVRMDALTRGDGWNTAFCKAAVLLPLSSGRVSRCLKTVCGGNQFLNKINVPDWGFASPGL